MQNALLNIATSGGGQQPFVGDTSTALSNFDLKHLNQRDRAELVVVDATIRAELNAVGHASTTALVHGFALGEALIALKKLHGRGFWMREGEAWVNAKYGLSARSARDYMRLASHREALEDQIGSSAANLSVRGALRLIGPAKTARKRVKPSGLKTANWRAATTDQRAAFVSAIPLTEWLEVIPADWRAEIGDRSNKHVTSLERQVAGLKKQVAESVPLRLVKTTKKAA